MDHDAFRKTYRDMNDRFCLFEKSILSGQCGCALAERFCLAEREGVHCRSDEAQQQCQNLIRLLRQHSRFTLKSSDETGTLPHAKAIRLQVGGLRGLHASLHDQQPPASSIKDIHDLINKAAETFNGLDHLPFQEIIKQIAAYKGRSRRSRS